jgi:hypothetical protein
MVLADMEKRHTPRAEQMLVAMADEIVDLRQPGLDRHERDGMGGVDDDPRSVLARRRHDLFQ